MRLRKSILSIFSLSIFLFSSLAAQTVESVFETFPATIAKCFLQDTFGFVWIGTQDGLLRYDGIAFKQYNYIPFDSTSLSGNNILDIKEDKFHNLWIATHGNGLNYYDQMTGIFTRFAGNTDSNPVMYIFGIIVNDDNSLWLASPSHGLTYFKMDVDGKPVYRHYRLLKDSVSAGQLNRNSAITLYKDREGILWIGTVSEGMLRFNPGTGSVTQFKHDPQDPYSISHNTVSCICEDDSGNLWIGTGHGGFSSTGGGLSMYNRTTGQFKHFTHSRQDENSISGDMIYSILIDKSGIMWIGTWTNYLNSIALKELISGNDQVFTHHTNFENGNFMSVYEDRSGTIWVGERNLKAYRFSRQQKHFELLSRTDEYPNSLSADGSMCIFCDHKGRIWSNSGGLDLYIPETGRYKHYYFNRGDSTGLCSNQIYCIQEDSEGNIWVSTKFSGIDILNPLTGRVRHFRHIPQKQSESVPKQIMYLQLRSNGDMWIASPDNEIQLYETNTNKIYTFHVKDDSTSAYIVSKLYEDRQGTLWIGTGNDGIYTLKIDESHNPEIFHYHHDPADTNSLCSDAISDFIQPAVVDTSAIWIATSSGLNRLDLKTGLCSHIYREDGLATNWIAIILEDDRGNLWCATPNGLTFFEIKTGRIINYSQADGLPEKFACGAFRQNSAKGTDGRLYFAGGGGILTFRPQAIEVNQNIPAVRLTDFRIFGKSVPLDTSLLFKRTIILDHKQNVFSFQFAALNFNNSDKNQYKYKLEGFQNSWINIGNRHSATFTNLHAGEYVFRVIGSNNHGIWNETGASVRIIILPPWWRTNWAYFIYALLFVSFAFGSIRFEVKRRQRKFEQQLQKEREKEEIRSRIASDLHDEIGSNLSSIALISEMLEKKIKIPQVMRKRLREIPRIARITAESMRDIVWFVNPENDDMDKLLAKMRGTANMMLKTFEYSFTTPDTVMTLKPDLELRRNFYLFYKECLQNIVKHAAANKVDISIRKINNCLQLSLSDDGVGFDTQKVYSGNGLKNLRQRAETIGGELKIRSDHGKGTDIILKINIP